MRALIVVTTEDEIAALMGWAKWLEDEGDHEDVFVLCALLAKQEQAVQSLAAGANHDHPLVQLVLDEAAQIDKGLSLRCYRGSRLVDAIGGLVSSETIDLVVVANSETSRARFGEESTLASVLVGDAHCDVMMVDTARPPRDCSRILVPVSEGPHCQRALQLARELADRYDGQVTSFYVGEEDNDDALAWSERNLEQILQAAKLEKSRVISRRPVIARNVSEAVVAEIASGYDMVLVGATDERLLAHAQGIDPVLLGASNSAAFATVRSEAPLLEKSRRVLHHWLESVFPHLGRDGRLDLFDHLRQGSNASVDFITLMALSTAIASLGLIQNSGAVVIGAMLVAPLMTPMIGAGLGLVQGNLVLVQTASRAILLGFLLALGVGFFFGLWSPLMPALTPEIVARCHPNLLDLWIALFSGVAAAYALARPGLVAALPGVAIAAALVPPIATVGICLAVGQLSSAAGAALLFATNLVAIIIASAGTLYLMGIRGSSAQTTTRLFVRRTWTLLFVSVVVLSIPLAIALLSNYAEDEVLLSAAVEQVVAQHSQLELDGVELSHVNDELRVLVRVYSKNAVAKGVAQTLAQSVRAHVQEPCSVRVVTLMSESL